MQPLQAGQPLPGGQAVSYAGQPLGSGDVTAQAYPQALPGAQQQDALPLGTLRSRLFSADCSPKLVLPAGSTTWGQQDNSPSPGSRGRSATWGGVSPWNSPVVSPQSSFAPPPAYLLPQAGAASPGTAPPAGQALHLQAGSHTLKGAKPGMPDWINQDVSVVIPLEQSRVLAAVFDGHGKHGHTCSRQACTVIMQQASSIFPPGADLMQSFHTIFQKVHLAIAALGPEIANLSGCTGTIALIDPKTTFCHVGHVGDSTAIVANCRGLVFTSQDHKFDAQAEARINAKGGEVRRCEKTGAVRVYGRGQQTPGLALARSLGDLEGNSVGVSEEPDVDLNIPFDAGFVLVLASDGLWDALPKEGVGAKAGSEEPKECATTMVQDARHQWATAMNAQHIDDITCVIVKALPREGGGGSPQVSPRIQALAVQLPVGATGSFAPPLGSTGSFAPPVWSPGGSMRLPPAGGGGSMSLSPGGRGGSMTLPPGGGGSMSLSPGGRGGSMNLPRSGEAFRGV
mmetsp:Transcript_8904/g.19944  ORF Transcript_8904/g.19944 Transcript_8904/m.19944 type:complete len:512 (+) Transcript_8904:117-1652(+)